MVNMSMPLVMWVATINKNTTTTLQVQAEYVRW